MPDTIIIKSKEAVRSPAVIARENHALKRHGAKIIDELPEGIVAKISRKRIKQLQAAGFAIIRFKDTDQLHLAGRKIDIHEPSKGLNEEDRVPAELESDWPLHVVQLIAPPFPHWQGQLREQGLDILGRAGEYSLYLHGSPDDIDKVRDLPFVTMVSPLHPAWKMDERLAHSKPAGRQLEVSLAEDGTSDNIHTDSDSQPDPDSTAEDSQPATDGPDEVSITVFPKHARDEVLAAVVKLGGRLIREEMELTSDQSMRLIVALDRSEARRLAVFPNVKYVGFLEAATLVGERQVQVLAENLDAAAAPNTGPVPGYQAFTTAVGATGAGVTVAICDSGIDQGNNNNTTGHLDLRGRQAAYVDYNGVVTDQNGHGTHVAGIAVGNGATGTTEAAAPNNFLWGQGVAPGAQYVGQNMQSAANPTGPGLTVPAMATLANDSVTNGASIQNNSWSGTGSPNSYTQREADIDAAVRDAGTGNTTAEPMTIVYAASNDGGLPGTIGSPSAAKNVITVGNGLSRRPNNRFPDDDIRGINGSSSRGPASGGRIKPDIIAPGTDISSTRSAASTDQTIAGAATFTYKSGTSMAAPAISGACALLTEWWRNRSGGQTPSPAMLKALLINGAEDMVGGSNWRTLTGTLTNVANDIYTITGVPFTPTALSVANLLLTQVASTSGMADQTWNFNAASSTLTVRIALIGNPSPVGFACLDTPLTNIPNNDQGWGRASLENIVFQSPASDRGPRLFLDQRQAFTATDQVHSWRIVPADTSRPMRATLVWTDVPGAVNDGTPLVNNLDLELEQTNGSNTTTWRGGANNFNNGFTTPGGANNNVDNVECIYLQNPSGTYDLHVRAASVTGDARDTSAAGAWQDYALVLENAVFAAADPVSISLLIDRSGSMKTSG